MRDDLIKLRAVIRHALRHRLTGYREGGYAFSVDSDGLRACFMFQQWYEKDGQVGYVEQVMLDFRGYRVDDILNAINVRIRRLPE